MREKEREREILHWVDDVVVIDEKLIYFFDFDKKIYFRKEYHILCEYNLSLPLNDIQWLD